MSRLYSLLIDARPPGNGTGPEVDGFAGIDGYSGDVPYIEVGGPDGEEHAVIQPAGETTGPTDEDLFSVRLLPFETEGAACPAASESGGLIAMTSPEHPVSRDYLRLAEQIIEQTAACGPSVLTFASPMKSAGTTTVVLNLAITLARGGARRVAVVEATSARPAFAVRLSVPRRPGLGELLAGDSTFTAACHPVSRAGITAIPVGRVGHELADMGRFLSTLKHRFDWVLVDAGVDALTDTEWDLAEASDACYFVARETDAEDERLRELRARLSGTNRPPRGVVLTSPA